MNKKNEKDLVWLTLRKEIEIMADAEPMLASYLHAVVFESSDSRRRAVIPAG